MKHQKSGGGVWDGVLGFIGAYPRKLKKSPFFSFNSVVGISADLAELSMFGLPGYT